jgi:hypothetical protein
MKDDGYFDPANHGIDDHCWLCGREGIYVENFYGSPTIHCCCCNLYPIRYPLGTPLSKILNDIERWRKEKDDERIF